MAGQRSAWTVAVIKALERDGWYEKAVTGSHHHVIRPTKPGAATAPHPRKDPPIGTVRRIERRAGSKLRR
ncbi:MAG: type II toxin-antitoxin system HicA family toxin [Geminicoccaceae bacterium]|nr:type II toxin-antitoxin system HicA family toxin [Geminicoccaceae bacterium]